MPTIPVDQRDCRSVKVYGDPTFQFEIRHR